MAYFYRRRKHRGTWHFCSNCQHWPTVDYMTSRTEPTGGEICNECQSKRKRGECK